MGDLEGQLASAAPSDGGETTPHTPARSYPKGAWVVGMLIIVAAVFGLNHKLITGRASPVWDADGYFAPYYTLVADAARSGHLLLWDPWTTCGSPAGVDPQVGAFSPLMLTCGLISGGHLWGFAAYWLSIWAFGGIGMLMLGRWLGAPPWGALVVALGFTFCGVFTVQSQYTSHLVSLAFLPWIIWRLDRALLNQSWLAAAEAGALLGLSSLSGYPTMTLASGGLAVMWIAARCISGIRGEAQARVRRRGWRAAGSVLILGLVSLAVFAPCYISFSHETQGFSGRHGEVAREVATRHGIAYLNLATSLSSALPAVDAWRTATFTDSAASPRLLSGDASCTSIYIGIFPLVLAFAGFITRPKDVFRWLLLAILAGYLSCAMSTVLPVCGWLYDLVPPLRYSRHAVLFRDYAMFLALILATLTVRDLNSGSPTERRNLWAWLALGFTLVTIAIVAVWNVAGVSAITSPAYRWAQPVSIGLAAAGALICGFGRSLHDRWAGNVLKRWGSVCASAIVLFALADAYLSYRWSKPFIMADDRSDEARWHNLQASHDASLEVASIQRQQGSIYNNYQVISKTPSLMGYTVLTNSDYVAMSDDGTLERLAGASGRFWFASKAIPAELGTAKPTRRPRPTTSPAVDAPRLRVTSGESVLLTDAAAKREAQLPLATTSPSDKGSLLRPVDVQGRRYDLNELELTATFAEPGWLLVTDRWSPSWKADVNGSAVPVYIGQRVFRAVQVPAGPCTIDFRFDPPYLRWVILSWAVMAGVGIWSLWTLFRQHLGSPKQGA